MLIGICGLAGSGKDTVADLLVKEAGFVKLALADELKRICQTVYGFTSAQLWGESAERNNPDTRYPRASHIISAEGEGCRCCGVPNSAAASTSCFLTPRFALQQLGTEWGRYCYDDTWIQVAVNTYDRLQKGGCYYDQKLGLRYVSAVEEVATEMVTKKNVVIPDVRFINEIQGLHNRGAKIVKIVRPGAGLSGAAGAHASETELAGIADNMFDAVIQNTGTLPMLYEEVRRVLKRFQ